jgi:hypothetical protein
MSFPIRLSIAVPTVGRPTLYRTLRSISTAGVDRKLDEIIVVGDGRCPEGERISSFFRELIPVSYTELKLAGQCAGHPARSHAFGMATGTHLMTIDDDDEYVPGALGVVRDKVSEAPDRPHIFRMVGRAKRNPFDVLWRERAVAECNLGSPLFVVPNNRSRLGIWGKRYAGDYDFIRSTVDLYPERDAAVVWHEEIIAEIH